jgi:endonuclease G
MSESFFLSNMVPQVANNNRGIWKQLETQVRDWVITGNRDVYVVSGPIFDAGYTTIGPNRVAVPTRLFKVIVDKTRGKIIAFIFPNTALPVADLPKYTVPVADVERATGFNFNPRIPAQFAPLEAKREQLQGF